MVFDYVIVGAGSAGCVLARRLTEDPSVRVLLLEAGGSDRQREIQVPTAFPKLFQSACDWTYFTEPQANLRNRRIYWPRGKVLGGSSSINAMIYIRGHRSDFDRWSELGNPGWSFADVLPYFKRGEDQQRGASDYHGVGGPLRVEDLRTINPLSRAFVEAAVELGLPRNPDFNGPEQDGVGFYQVTQRRGRRESAATAYLKPALARPNLTVRTGAHATRLLVDKTRVTGAAFVCDGKLAEARVTREVILCGGAVNSPQLLMLSGIGPAEHLKSLDIPVVADLPGVGQNLLDHLFLPVAYTCTQPVSLEGAETPGNLLKYLLLGRGPLTSNIAEAGGFIRTRVELCAPDLQFHFGPLYYLSPALARPEGHGFTLGPTLIRPQSRGWIRLRSSDPFAPPAIQPHYLSSETELRLLVEGIRLARRLAQARALDAFRGREVYPGAEKQSDADLAEYVRAAAETVYHPVGTCKMGSDPTAVVNAKLRVRGVDGLRVADASVMPTIVGGNTNAATLLIAEKAAELISGRAPGAPLPT